MNPKIQPKLQLALELSAEEKNSDGKTFWRYTYKETCLEAGISNVGGGPGKEKYLVILYSLCTPPEKRNSGQARKLLQYFIEQLASTGRPVEFLLRPAPLDEETSQERLIDFYSGFGFTIIPYLDQRIGKRITDLAMRLAINQKEYFMNILAVNGSPRKHWNTEIILEHALEGTARAFNSHLESVRLYPMEYSGCTGCYACKQKGKPSSICRFKDTLTPILEKAQEADVILLGTPVYFFTESSGTRAFIERLLYPWSAFNTDGYGTRRPKPMVAGLFYTLAGTEESVAAHGHKHFMDSTNQFFSLHFIHHEILLAYETLHTNSYDKLELNTFDPEARRKSREGRFVADCERARAIGSLLVQKAKAAHA